jgi:hypothetical protein
MQARFGFSCPQSRRIARWRAADACVQRAAQRLGFAPALAGFMYTTCTAAVSAASVSMNGQILQPIWFHPGCLEPVLAPPLDGEVH